MERWLAKHEKNVIWGAVAAFFLTITALCFAKYARLGYDVIDLAYFNQVFWNTVRGRLFVQSIHPHLSLGDHAELIIPFLTPVYALWQDPRMLIAMQSAALALTAWPVWLIAKHHFQNPNTKFERTAPIILTLAWLGGPLLQNIAFFEFHILPFALLPLLFSLYAYRQDRRADFIAWSACALLVREDVALAVAGVSLLAFLERRSWWWRTVPLALGAAWFVAAMSLIKHFAPTGGYKFATYYGWLGDSASEITLSVLNNPVALFSHIAKIQNLEMLLGLMMAFAFLPLFSASTLILAAGPAAQILLGQAGGGALVFQTHYSTLFLPALLLATVGGYGKAPEYLQRIFTKTAPNDARILTVSLVILSAAYSAVTLGPLPDAFARTWQNENPEAARAAREILALVPDDAAVASSYELMPELSSRQSLYAAHYMFLGKTQFAEKDYPAPDDLRYTVFHLDDLLTYQAQFPRTAWTAPYHADGLARLTSAIGQPIARRGQILLFDRLAEKSAPAKKAWGFNEPLNWGGFMLSGADMVDDKNIFRLTTEWVVPTPPAAEMVLTLTLTDHQGRIVRKARSAFDTLPSVFISNDGKRVTILEMSTTNLAEGVYSAKLELSRQRSDMVMTGDRGTELKSETLNVFGELLFEDLKIGR